MENRAALVASTVISLLVLLSVAQAATLTVCQSGCDHVSVQSAMSSASSGDTILISDSGGYQGNITINASINLTSNSTTRPTIFSDSASPTILISGSSGASVSNMIVIYNGTSSSGSAMTIQSAAGSKIQNNVVNATGSDENHVGLIIISSSSTTVSGNEIYTTGPGQKNYGVHVKDGSEGNEIINNTVRTMGDGGLNEGVRIESSRNNTVSQNIIFTDDDSGSESANDD